MTALAVLLAATVRDALAPTRLAVAVVAAVYADAEPPAEWTALWSA